MKFTWHDKFTKTIEKLPPDKQGEMVLAMIGYGTYGEEPDLEYPLSAIFESFREDIDYSKEMRKRGSNGGSASKKASENSGEDQENTLLESEEDSASKHASKQNESCLEANTVHSNTVHSSTDTKEEKDSKKKKFAKPTLEELEVYASDIGYDTFNAQRFLDYYESNGWKVGRNPMKDWRATVRQWRSRDEEMLAERLENTKDDAYYAQYD